MQTLNDIIDLQVGRRRVLQRIAAASGLALPWGLAAPAALAAKPAANRNAIGDYESLPHHKVGKQRQRAQAREPAVAKGFEIQVVAKWGDPIVANAPAFEIDKQTGAAQAQQFGYNNDYVGFLPLPLGSQNSDHGLLCVNHEHTTVELMFPGLKQGSKRRRMSHREIEVDMEAHGVTIAEVRRRDGRWQIVANSKLNRRLSLTTKMQLSGPVAGTRRVQTDADPTGTRVFGTVANCAGGVTPWGTLLSAEENFQYYFRKLGRVGDEEINHRTYALKSGKPYYKVDERFNTDKHPTEPNRFGWIVEVDPYDPTSTPKKRTALGRFRHEGANTSVSDDGRLVVYMGDDSAFEFLYKFVSRRAYDPHNRKANADLLDDGTLYVARFEKNGKVKWLPLTHGFGPLDSTNGFFNQADVLIETRRAARLLGATSLDRPEDVEENRLTGNVFVMLTNNKHRSETSVNPASPRAKNSHGHVLELQIPRSKQGSKHSALEHGWNLFLLCGNPSAGGWYQGHRPREWVTCPDNCAFDNQGRLWITTDGAEKAAGFVDAVYSCETLGPRKAETRQFFRAPLGAEICGPSFTPDNSTLFLAIQHPGAGSDLAHPSTRWPNPQDSKLPPMPAVVAITKSN